MNKNRIFISADHGLAIVYFLQTSLVPLLIEKGVEVVILTDEGLIDRIKSQFSHPAIIFESLRLKEARKYSETVSPQKQYWLHYLRRFGSSNKINTKALDDQIPQVEFEARGKRRLLKPFMRTIISGMRQSKWIRNSVKNQQMKFIPGIYDDLFEKYQPGLVVASTPGWRLDRFLLREAHKRKIPTASVIVGWDNPSSYSLSGAPVDWINCWSEVQKQELILGSDWETDQVHVGGIPSYDGYFQKKWVMKKEEYYKLHGLDPNRKLIAYASSFVTFAPNFDNIKALADLVENNELDEPAQLLIRLHPNHFLPEPLYQGEREQVKRLVEKCRFVKLVEPVPLGGELGYYSGEDMPEKSSMMEYADVFTTVYSTMVVEAAIHDRPIVSVCIDSPGGWNRPDKFSLALTQIGGWPTHDRFRQANAGRVAVSKSELKKAINLALLDMPEEKQNRKIFVENEITFTDGHSAERVADFLYNHIGKSYRIGR
jgi:hypothetical protein